MWLTYCVSMATLNCIWSLAMSASRLARSLLNSASLAVVLQLVPVTLLCSDDSVDCFGLWTLWCHSSSLTLLLGYTMSCFFKWFTCPVWPARSCDCRDLEWLSTLLLSTSLSSWCRYFDEKSVPAHSDSNSATVFRVWLEGVLNSLGVIEFSWDDTWSLLIPVARWLLVKVMLLESDTEFGDPCDSSRSWDSLSVSCWREILDSSRDRPPLLV